MPNLNTSVSDSNVDSSTTENTPAASTPASVPDALEPTPQQKAVWEILDKALADNKPIPSIRTVRSLLGGGSMNNISEAIRDWKLAHIPSKAPPCGFNESTSKQIVDAIWKFASPSLEKRIEEERRICEEKVAIAKAEADKLVQTAQEELAEAKAMQAAVRQKIEDTKKAAKESNAKLRDELSQLKGMMKALEAQNTQLIKTNVRLEEGIAKATAAKAAAEANLATYRQLFPLLEKTLKKNKEA